MRVDEVAAGRARALPGWLTCSHGSSILDQLDLEAVPVVEDAQVIGVATRRAMLAAPDDAPLRHALAPRPTACRARQPVGEALALMRARRLRDLPVLDDSGRPVATLRLRDVILTLALGIPDRAASVPGH